MRVGIKKNYFFLLPKSSHMINANVYKTCLTNLVYLVMYLVLFGLFIIISGLIEEFSKCVSN